MSTENPSSGPGPPDPDRISHVLSELEALRREQADWLGVGIGEENLERPALLALMDGRTVELPDCTVGDALALLKLAAPVGALVAGEFDLLEVAGVTWPEAEEQRAEERAALRALEAEQDT